MNENKSKALCIIAYVIVAMTILNTIFLTILMFSSGNNAKTGMKHNLEEQKELYTYAENVFEKCVKYADLEIVKEDYSERIKGSVKNKSDKDLCDIQIELMCYDSFGDYVGLDTIYVSFLPANTSIQLNEYVSCDEAESVKVLRARAVYADDIHP